MFFFQRVGERLYLSVVVAVSFFYAVVLAVAPACTRPPLFFFRCSSSSPSISASSILSHPNAHEYSGEQFFVLSLFFQKSILFRNVIEIFTVKP